MMLFLWNAMSLLSLSIAIPTFLSRSHASDDLPLLEPEASLLRTESSEDLEWMRIRGDRPDGGVNDCLDVPFGGVPVGDVYSYPSPRDTRYNSSGTSRCYRAYVPPSDKPGPKPVIIYFHSMHSSATAACRRDGGHYDLYENANAKGYALVCADANVHWDVPEATKSNPAPCSTKDSWDHFYVVHILRTIHSQPDVFDSSKIFFAGHSEGSMFTTWASYCFADKITGFAQSGVGLKLHGNAVTKEHCEKMEGQVGGKGRGLLPSTLDPEWYPCKPSTDDGMLIPGGWGGCDDCEYNPLKPWRALNSQGEDLQVCLFSGCDDYFLPSVWAMQEHLDRAEIPYHLQRFDGAHVLPQGYGAMIASCFKLSDDWSVSNNATRYAPCSPSYVKPDDAGSSRSLNA